MDKTSISTHYGKLSATLAASMCGLFVFFIATSPAELPIVLIVVPFILLYLGMTIGLLMISSVIPVFSRFRERQKILLSACITAVPFLLVIFQTLHQLTIRDVMISFGLFAGLVFYLYRADYLQ